MCSVSLIRDFLSITRIARIARSTDSGREFHIFPSCLPYAEDFESPLLLRVSLHSHDSSTKSTRSRSAKECLTIKIPERGLVIEFECALQVRWFIVVVVGEDEVLLATRRRLPP